jgi:hypothetical protein
MRRSPIGGAAELLLDPGATAGSPWITWSGVEFRELWSLDAQRELKDNAEKQLVTESHGMRLEPSGSPRPLGSSIQDPVYDDRPAYASGRHTGSTATISFDAAST